MFLGTLVRIGIASVVALVVVYEFTAAVLATDCTITEAHMSGYRACQVVASCEDGTQRRGALGSPNVSSCPKTDGVIYSPLYGGLRWASLLDGYWLSIAALSVGVPLGALAGALNPRRYEPAVVLPR